MKKIVLLIYKHYIKEVITISAFNIKTVHINANNPLSLKSFYESLGFESKAENNKIYLSVNKKVFLIIHETSLEKRNEASLYYFSITVPTKKDLSKITNHLIFNRIKIQASLKHNIGYSVFINDPEGNGVQIFYQIPEITEYKKTEDFLLDEISSWSSCRVYRGLPKDSTISNIHFHIPEIDPELSFYEDTFNLKAFYKTDSIAFLTDSEKFPCVCFDTWLKVKPDKKIKGHPGIFMYEIEVPKEISNKIISEMNTNIIESPNKILIKVS